MTAIERTVMPTMTYELVIEKLPEIVEVVRSDCQSDLNELKTMLLEHEN